MKNIRISSCDMIATLEEAPAMTKRNARQCQRCAIEYVPGVIDSVDYCRMCVMLLSAAPPQIKTEATFQAKAGLGGSQFHPATRDLYLQRAREAGVTTEGRVYEPRLAAFPGDPEAWISNQDELKAVAERKGYSVEGDVTVKQEFAPPPPPTTMATDILEDLMETKLEDRLGPDFVQAKGAVVERARDEVLQEHGIMDHATGVTNDGVRKAPKMPVKRVKLVKK